MKFVNIGFGSIIPGHRLVAIADINSSPMKKLVQDNKAHGLVIDATFGRKTRSVLIIDSGHIVLSCLQQKTIANRLEEV